jgi:limonene-1,2-epoxide hydrolase
MGSLAIVEAWLAAVDRRDGPGVERLTAERVEIEGPRGRGTVERGMLTEWMGRAGFSATSLRWFCGAGGEVVVEQDARWVDVATGAERGRARVASQFAVQDGRVVRYVRRDAGLSPALAAAGLTPHDEVTHRR